MYNLFWIKHNIQALNKEPWFSYTRQQELPCKTNRAGSGLSCAPLSATQATAANGCSSVQVALYEDRIPGYAIATCEGVISTKIVRASLQGQLPETRAQRIYTLAKSASCLHLKRVRLGRKTRQLERATRGSFPVGWRVLLWACERTPSPRKRW